MIKLRNAALLLVLAVLAALGCGGQPLVEFPLGVAPVVVSTNPADAATGVALDSTIRATFSAAMSAEAITAETFFLKQGASPVSATVTSSGSTAVLTPAVALAEGSTFTATVAAGITDEDGNALLDDHVWSFTTAPSVVTKDTTPPAVLSTDPLNGAVGIAIDASLSAVFSEAMDPSTIDDTTFELTQGAMSVAGSVSYTGTTATFAPTAALFAGIPYTATITTGAKDLAGNALAADSTWTFTTGTPPEVITTNPVNGAFGVAVDRQVEATFDVAMDASTLDDASFTLKQGAVPVPGTVTYAGMTATFTPVNDYPHNAILTATITTAARDKAGNALLQDFVWTFQTGSKTGQEQVPLGSASTFAILAFNTVTNVNNPGTIVTGDLGISPGAALVGFPPGEVIGATHAGDAVAATAKVDLLTAYNDAAGRLGAAVLPGDLSGLTFYPGLYKSSSSVMLSAGNFTLDAQGDVNAVFIFQMGSTFTSSPGTQMVLSGGAKATNIYWSVGTSATLGTNTIFKGTLLVSSAITMSTGAAIEGRLLALGAAVALDTNTITVPSP
jgi:hypothetical protein